MVTGSMKDAPIFHQPSLLKVFISESGLSCSRVLKICLLLDYCIFVSAAGCHCFDLRILLGFVKLVFNKQFYI